MPTNATEIGLEGKTMEAAIHRGMGKNCAFEEKNDDRDLRRGQSNLSTAVSDLSTAVPLEGLHSRREIDSNSDCNGNDSPTFSPEETLIILDWDDTILPTTWLTDQGCTGNVVDLKHWHKKQLKMIAERAARTLRIAKKLGQVVIITNAKAGWVELSCHRYMPTLRPWLQGVRVISARSTYETPLAATPSLWKHLAFQYEVKAFHEQNGFVNIVSIGDAIYEQQALTAAADQILMCHAKAIKLDEKPAPGRIAREHEEIGTCLQDLVDYDGDLHLSLKGEGDQKMLSLADKFRELCSGVRKPSL